MSFKADQQQTASNPSMTGPERLTEYMRIYQANDHQIDEKVRQDEMDQIEHSATAKAASKGPDTGGAAKSANTRKVRYNKDSEPV